ncbi:MAG: hypothetical protein C0403_18835 [Desulfobacterium sp.]|nr:hypothetical protein [Desulfobacterium sp.]
MNGKIIFGTVHPIYTIFLKIKREFQFPFSKTGEPISKRFKSVIPAKADVQKRTEKYWIALRFTACPAFAGTTTTDF